MAYGPRLYQDYTHMQEAVDKSVIHIIIIVQMLLLFKTITMIFLILYITITPGHNFLLLFCRIRVPRSLPGMLVAIIDGSRPTSILSLGLRVAFVTLLLIASIAGVVLSSVFTEWWVSLLISVYMSWCLRFSPRFPSSGSSLSAGPGGAKGVWPSLSLIGVTGCLGWV